MKSFCIVAQTGDGPYTNAVVAADAGLCSELGRDILKKKGSAVDSAIATLFCVGVINMHSAGIGGGGFMTVYHKSSNKVEVFDYREVAPLRADKNMYVNGSLNSRYGKPETNVISERNVFSELRLSARITFIFRITPLFNVRFLTHCNF